MSSIRVDAQSFARLSQALKGFDDDLRKELLSGVRKAARPLQKELRAAITATNSSATSTGGARSRAAWALRGHQGTSKPVLQASGLAARAAGRAGLRQSIARSVRIVAKDSGYAGQVGVRISTSGAGLPPDQRKLPRHMNTGTWRHPIFGTKAWAKQTVSPAGWWTTTSEKYAPQARAEVENSVRTVVTKLAGSIGTAA